jgi:integrase/recombinase XerD
MKGNDLAHYIPCFLQDYLTLQKGFSRHTILSYRDAIKLLLNYVSSRKIKPVNSLTLADLGTNMVIDFLEYLEKERSNSSQSRNVRLSCLHSLFRYIASHDPLISNHCQRILGIPFKRTQRPAVDYLELEEIKAILAAVDRSSCDGDRDYTLLLFMYETGARVGEIVSLPVKALQLERPFYVRFLGKGAKERLCPILPETVKLLRSLLKQRQVSPKADVPVFVNRRGDCITRHGVRYLLTKYVRIAAGNCPSLKEKSVHPHTMRHTCAMHMLQSGVDINSIRAWLGHVNLETTNRYARTNLEMKRKILEKHLAVPKSVRPWKRNNGLLEWLDSLTHEN